jgi:GT2 family glycosyltransferase
MVRVIFSLVLYKHSLDEIKPLLHSIEDLKQSCQDICFHLSIYDADRPGDADRFRDSIASTVRDLSFSYVNAANVGFARANNFNAGSLDYVPSELFIVANPDTSFLSLELAPLLYWVLDHKKVSCASPLVINPGGATQYSAKHNPTFLSLLLGKLPVLTALTVFSRYDFWHRNLGSCYEKNVISSTYLSGCFLVIPSLFFREVGGFSARYFLHLEDADIVRRLSGCGLTVHNPIGKVSHRWARGSHKSFTQTLHLLRSIVVYMLTWGMSLW